MIPLLHLLLELIGAVALMMAGRLMYLMGALGNSLMVVYGGWIVGLAGAGFGIWASLSYLGVL